MTERAPIPTSSRFDAIARGSRFRDCIAVAVRAAPETIFQALREVTLRDMKLAWLLGELRYLPSRLAGRLPPVDSAQPFLAILLEGGTLVLHDDTPHEIITGSAATLQRVHQDPKRFAGREAFDAFHDPDHQKLFMSVRTAPTGRPDEQWLVLEHATLPLSPGGERAFSRYWRLIRPAGAFVSWLLLRAVRRKAEAASALGGAGRRWRSVRATAEERRRVLPGDERIPEAMGALTHAITIRRDPRDIWPWLVQMGAGSRGGWYSYDWLDNGRQPSATRVIQELQEPEVGTVFPALPGVTDGFTLLAIDRERSMTLGWVQPDGSPLVTWSFVLEEVAPGVTRLVVRARGGQAYRFRGLPRWLSLPVARLVHFLMERKQLLGIAGRVGAEARAGTDGRLKAA